MRLLGFSLLAGFALALIGCTAECLFDTDCEASDICRSGSCTPASLSQLGLGMCDTHADCSPRERCRSNRCEMVTSECAQDADCPSGKVCSTGRCVDDTNPDGCPSRPPTPPCTGHSANCPCIAGDYRFLPRAGCQGLSNAAVTVLQSACEISILVNNFTMTGTISPDGEMTLMGDLLRCNATGAGTDSGFELDCQGCVIGMVPFLPPLPSVEISSGTFFMGSDDAEAEIFEGPMHQVTLSCYRMDVIEVTNRHYHECVEQPHDRHAVLCDLPAGISFPNDLLHPDLADLPVRGVTFTNAERFCTMRGGKLPTEAQWEKAARGSTDSRSWPWGDDAAGACAYDHFAGCVPNEPIPAAQTSGTSPYGVKNMGGNVRNWVRDAWSPTVYDSRVGGTIVEDPSGPSPSGNPERVIKGGSYLLPVEESQVYRRRNAPVANLYTEAMQDVGLRCVR